MSNPTKQTYDALNKAYDFFNKRLFAGQLPRCLVTLQRQSHTLGFFDHKRFAKRGGDGITDEIALNPRHFKERTTEDSLSTLVHEMVHQRQWHFGKPRSHGYHDKEWASMMKEIGLYPSTTAQPGGKEIGKKVSHYIVRGGPFDVACAALIKLGCDISYVEVGRNEEKAKKKRESKTKYTCPKCELNAWAKPDAHLRCDDCQLLMSAP